MNIFKKIKELFLQMIYKTFRKIKRKEQRYQHDYEIGKLNDKNQKVKLHRFLHELIIDLKLNNYNITPYEFLFFILLGGALISILISVLVFAKISLSLIIFPITTIGLTCILYTKANIAHDKRIEAVIESENIICNNIKDGIVVAVRNNINVFPKEVKYAFAIFLDDVENKNYHIKSALLNLNNNLGTISNDFIKKCIVFETEEEHGVAEMFLDIVEINNIKTELRTNIKRSIEEIKAQFILGTIMILLFLGGVIAIYDVVAQFYFKNTIGQILLIVDALIIILEFVYITYLRAKEI